MFIGPHEIQIIIVCNKPPTWLLNMHLACGACPSSLSSPSALPSCHHYHSLLCHRIPSTSTNCSPPTVGASQSSRSSSVTRIKRRWLASTHSLLYFNTLDELGHGHAQRSDGGQSWASQDPCPWLFWWSYPHSLPLAPLDQRLGVYLEWRPKEGEGDEIVMICGPAHERLSKEMRWGDHMWPYMPCA